MFLLPLLCDLERELDESGHSMASKNGRLCGDLPWLASVTAATLTSIFALAVFADDDPI